MGSWTVQVFYDGECPLCMREISLLRRLDRRGNVWFTDIAGPEFDAAAWGNTQRALMDRIHGRLPDGRWIEGVEVFRQLYRAVGLGPIAWFMGLPGISAALDWGYRVFASNRLRWTGRCDELGCTVPNADLTRAA